MKRELPGGAEGLFSMRTAGRSRRGEERGLGEMTVLH